MRWLSFLTMSCMSSSAERAVEARCSISFLTSIVFAAAVGMGSIKPQPALWSGRAQAAHGGGLRKKLGVEDGGDGVQPLQQGWGWRVEPGIGNAVNVLLADGAHLPPAALRDNLLQGTPVT